MSQNTNQQNQGNIPSHNNYNHVNNDVYNPHTNQYQQPTYTQPVNYNQHNYYPQQGSYPQQNYYPQQNTYPQQGNHPVQGNYNTQVKQPPRNHTALIIIVSVCLVVVIACAVLVALVMTGTLNTNKLFGIFSQNKVTEIVPTTPKLIMNNYVNTNYATAVAQLEAMEVTVITEFRFDENIEKDLVCEQSIATGTTLKKGDTVTLYVSKGADICPYEYSQKVVVTSSGSKGTLKLFNWQEGEWKEDFSCTATVGKKGISSNYGEGIAATPKGTFKLGFLIAPQSIGNSDWPLYKATENTCVVDDSDSFLYNQIKEVNNLPSGTHYDRLGATLTNGTCSGLLFIEHNGNGSSRTDVVAGKGSAITICGMNGKLSATYGCIDISSTNFSTLMSKLDYSKNTHIEITN